MAVESVQSIINGVTQTLIYNEATGYYEKDIIAPSGSSYNVNDEHYYPVTIKATDSAGNITIVNDTSPGVGANLRLRVTEKVPPVITSVYPDDDAMLIDPFPTISWNVTDNDSGVNPESIRITVDDTQYDTSEINKIPISGGYSCSCSVNEELFDGTHTVYFDAADFDGNSAIQRTVNFKIDTVPPELTVTSPVNNFVTNQIEISVSGTARDITTGIKSVTVSVNNGDPVTVSIGENNEFATNISLNEGSNRITVRATDNVDKYSEITRVVVLDITPPMISEIKIAPNPVETEELITISVMATD